jgi:hypothetical protein
VNPFGTEHLASGAWPPSAPPVVGSPSPTAVLAFAIRALLACGIVGFFVWQSFYDHAADFKTFFSAGYAVRHPEIPLYDLVALEENPFGEVFKLAPPAAVYLVPVSFGTIQQARLAWRITLVIAFLAAYAIVAHAVGLSLLDWTWLVGLAAWSVFGPLQIAVGEGQWDPIFLLLIAVATQAVAAGRSTISAISIAVAASIKPYPIALIGYFLARREWRHAAVTVVALASLLAIGALIVGVDEMTVFVTRVLPASGATTAYADNQALGGVIARAWSTDLKPFPLADAFAVDLAIKAIAVLLVGATILLVSRHPSDNPHQHVMQLSLFVPLSILVVPAAWTHYQAILLVPLTLLAVDQARHRPREPFGWLLLALTYGILLLPNPTMLYGPDIDRGLWLRSRADAANLALQRLYPTALSRLILSYKTFAVILLYGLLAWRATHPVPHAAPPGLASRVATPAGASS